MGGKHTGPAQKYRARGRGRGRGQGRGRRHIVNLHARGRPDPVTRPRARPVGCGPSGQAVRGEAGQGSGQQEGYLVAGGGWDRTCAHDRALHVDHHSRPALNACMHTSGEAAGAFSFSRAPPNPRVYGRVDGVITHSLTHPPLTHSLDGVAAREAGRDVRRGRARRRRGAWRRRPARGAARAPEDFCCALRTGAVSSARGAEGYRCGRSARRVCSTIRRGLA